MEERESTMELTDQQMHAKAELLFPARLIPVLRDLRGETWAQLVDRNDSSPQPHLDSATHQNGKLFFDKP